MSATDELRTLLDERGVGSYTHEAPAAVCLAFFDGKRWHDCWESTGGEVNVTFSMTPEQVVAATLGAQDLRAENAKLRELVEDMLDCIDIQIAFERVPARWMQDEFAGRASELGIEVD